MFEKEAEEYYEDVTVGTFQKGTENFADAVLTAYKDGAEFGYNKAKVEIEDIYRESLCNSELNLDSITEQLEELKKANEWHYVKYEGTPKVEGHYLVWLCNKDRDIFDCWIYYDKDVGWYSMKVRIKDIYAWKEIIYPELKEN